MHGEPEILCCEFCSHKTARKDNMERHIKSKHASEMIVSSVLNDIISTLGEKYEDKKEDNEMEAPDDDNLSLYERIRNQRVAAVQAEFKRLFPSFENEVLGLKVSRKKRKTGKTLRPALIVRRSGRKRSSVVSNCEDVSGSNEEDRGRTDEDSVVDDQTRSVVELQVSDTDNGGFSAGPAGDDSDMPELGFENSGQANPDLAALGKFGCIPCDMSFRDQCNLRRHVKRMHEPKLVPISCPRTWCKAEFSTMMEMINHRKNCLLACTSPGCSLTFMWQYRYDAHQRFHRRMEKRMKDW